MQLVLWTIVGIVVLAAACVLVALIPRVSVDIDLESGRPWRLHWRIQGLGGLVQVNRTTRVGARSGIAPVTRRKARPSHVPAGRLTRWATTPGLARRTGRLIHDIGRTLRVSAFYLDGELGLDDPADTGTLFGLMSPVLAGAWAAGLPIVWRPAFDEPGLRARGGARVHFRPVRLLWSVARFTLSVPVIRSAGRLLRRPA